MPFSSIYPIHPRTNTWNFCEKILRIGRAQKWHLFLVFGFQLFVFSKKNCFVFPNINQFGIHIRYHLFLHFKWFFENLGKDFIRTNMDMTVFCLEKLNPCWHVHIRDCWNNWYFLWTIYTNLSLSACISHPPKYFLLPIWNKVWCLFLTYFVWGLFLYYVDKSR